VEEDSERISGSKSTDVGGEEAMIISETGRTPRGVRRSEGAWTPDERKRRNRFAFSRGPASFLRIESLRLCFGKVTSRERESRESKHTVWRRADRDGRELEMVSVNEGVPVKFEWVGLVVADRELNFVKPVPLVSLQSKE
jgi:hypothetical protein